MDNLTKKETLDSDVTYNMIHFAVMAIEASAKKINISGEEMYHRLKNQDLIAKRLFAYYEQLHTQSIGYVVDDTLETLENWEKEDKEK